MCVDWAELAQEGLEAQLRAGRGWVPEQSERGQAPPPPPSPHASHPPGLVPSFSFNKYFLNTNDAPG